MPWMTHELVKEWEVDSYIWLTGLQFVSFFLSFSYKQEKKLNKSYHPPKTNGFKSEQLNKWTAMQVTIRHAKDKMD